MAEDLSGTSQPSPPLSPGGRTGPVLVPQAALLGKPDISLSRSVMTAGARASCRIHLVSRSISQYHALFINSSGSVAVCDLASRTGVLVNAKPVKYAELKNGDLVQLGKFVFRFRAPKPEAVAAPADPAVLDVPGDLPVPLDAKMLIVGRRETCDLPLTDDIDVSTLHAVLFQHDGHWIVRDLDSRTGTRLNGIRIHQAKLAFGDALKIGRTTFTFSPATDVLAEPSAAEVEAFPAPVEPAPQTFDEPTLALEPPPLDLAGVMPPRSGDAIDLEPLPLEEPEVAIDGVSPPEPDAAEASAEPDALELEPLELSATSHTAPPEFDAPELEPAAEAPPEPPTLPASDAEDPTGVEPATTDDETALDVGSASTFDLPLELDLAEEPRLGTGDGIADETVAGKSRAELPPTGEDYLAAVYEPAKDAPPIAAEPELPTEIFDGSIDVADDEPAAVSLESADAPAAPLTEPIDVVVNLPEPASAVDDSLPVEPAEPPAAFHAEVDEDAPAHSSALDELSPLEESAPAIDVEAGQPSAIAAVDSVEDVPVPASAIDELPPVEEVEPTGAAARQVPAIDTSEPSTEVAPEPLPAVEAIDELPPPVLTEAAASPPPLPLPGDPAAADVETETVDFGDTAPPEPPPVKPIRKRGRKPAAPKAPPASKAAAKPRRGGRKKVTPVVMDVVETLAIDPLPELPVVSGGSLLPEVAAAMELADGLPPVESIETGAMLGITAARPDEPTLTMTESMPAVPAGVGDQPHAVNLADTDAIEPVDTHDMSLPADDHLIVTTSTGLITEQLVVEIDTDAAPADVQSSSSDAGVIHEPSELLEEPTSLHTAATSEPFAELDALGQGEEFVAIPEPEPGDLQVTEASNWSADDALLETPTEVSADDFSTTEPGAEGQSNDVVADNADDADSGELLTESSVDDASTEPEDAPAKIVAEYSAAASADPSDQPVVLAPSQLAPPAESMMLGEVAEPGGPADAGGPPLFGFDFGAGSFLGGMPLQMQAPPPTFGKVGYAFDEKPSAAPRPPEPPAPEPAFTAMPQSSQPPMDTAPAALVDLDESSLLSYDEPTAAEPQQMSAVVNAEDAPLTAFDERIPLPPSARSGDDQTLTSTTSRPAINTLADEVAIPPLVSRSAEEQAPTRQTLTTAFDGLAGGLGAAVGNVDVFSQMAPPIHDELFGSRGDDPADVVLPSQQPEIPPSAPRRDPPPHIPPSDRTGPAKASSKAAPAPAEEIDYADETDYPRRDRYANDGPGRFARLPTLALLMLLCLIAAGMMIYFFLPPPVDVVGTLTFTNLSKQPVPAQRQFAINQISRLESGDVRNIARSIATNKAVGNGFLDDDMEFAKVTANADWDGDVMTLHQTATDEYAARTRMSALLEALSHKDADLNDTLASARAAAAAAHDAVAAQQQVIARIRADRETQVRIGDSAPRLEDVAVLERKANQLDAAWVAAKARRADAQLILDKLRQMDPATPTDPKDDPLLAELRAHLQQADVRLAVARATAAKPPANGPPPDTDLSALVTDVDQTRAAIDQRLATLSAEVKQTPEQRIMSRQAAIEAQSVKLATLQAAEADAAGAAQTAAIAARDQHAMLDAGRMASIKVEDLIHRQEAADQTLKELSADEAAKDDAVNQCVQVAATPKVDTKPGRDVRPISYAFAGGAIVLLFGVIAAVSMRPMPPPPVMPTAAAVPAAPIPVFGANRKPRPDARRPREAPTPQPDAASKP